MIKPSVYGQAIIILVCATTVTFTAWKGKDRPRWRAAILALACAFTAHVCPALIAIAVTVCAKTGKCRGARPQEFLRAARSRHSVTFLVHEPGAVVLFGAASPVLAALDEIHPIAR